MDKINTTISYSFNTELNIAEAQIPYISFSVLVKKSETDEIVQYGPDFLQETDEQYQEVKYAITKYYLKKIDNNQYLICLDFSIYTETDKFSEESFYGQNITVVVLITYLNSEGKYENKKYEL